MFDRITRQLLIVGAITASIIIGYSGLLYYSAVRADGIQDSRTGVLLRSKAIDHGEHIAAALENVVISDDLFTAVDKGNRVEFATFCGREDIASQFSTFGLLTADGHPLLLCEDGISKPVGQQSYVFDFPRTIIAGRFDEALALRDSKGVALPEFVYTQSFTEIVGRPYTMLTALVAPEQLEQVTPGHKPVIAFVLSNLRVVLEKLQDQLNIDGLEYQITAMDTADAVQSLSDKQGTSALTLNWRHTHQFRDQLLTSFPLIFAMALVMFQLLVSSLRKIGLLQQAIVEREEATRHMALHDGLTGLPNRIDFMSKAQQAVMASTAGQPTFIGMFDLDRFKAVNDTYGHDVGDRLIVEVARRVASILRPGDVVARLGGDEFALMLHSAQTDQEALMIMQRLHASVCQSFDCGSAHINPSASIGLAAAPRDGKILEDVLKAADIALYEVKSSGRGYAKIYRNAARPVPVSA